MSRHFLFFFLIDCTENATLEDPLEGVDFAPPLFFLSFFFYHIWPRHKRRNTHGEIPNQSRFTRISPLSTFDVETCQNYMEWCMKVASIQILKKSILYTLLFSKFPLNQEDTWNLIFFIHLHSSFNSSKLSRITKNIPLKNSKPNFFLTRKRKIDDTRDAKKRKRRGSDP